MWKGIQDNNFLFLFPNFDTVLSNSTPKKVSNIWRIKRDGISAKKFEAERIHFLSDVLVAVAVVVVKLPNMGTGANSSTVKTVLFDLP